MPDLTLHYEVTGAGEPLVLIHAAVGDSRQFDPQVPVFAERYRVIRYDAQGFGRSPAMAEPQRRADDLYDLLRQLEIPRAHLLGISNGGATAIDFNVLHPEMAGSLIAVAPGLSGFELSDPQAAAWSTEQEELQDAALQQGDMATALRINLGIWLAGPGREVDDVDSELRARVAELTRGAMTSWASFKPTPSLRPGAAQRLGEIKAPTLLIIGDQELAEVRATVDFLDEHVAGARRVEIADTAHWVNMERPEEFNRAVLDFLAAHPLD
jgi:3-oxoadipate enol-lactonase